MVIIIKTKLVSFFGEPSYCDCFILEAKPQVKHCIHVIAMLPLCVCACAIIFNVQWKSLTFQVALLTILVHS